MKIIRLFLAGLILLPQTQVGVQAQQPPPKQEQQKPDEDLGDPIRVDVDVVNVYCSVRNKQNNIVINLNKDDFDLAEDGQKQNIKYFTRETDIPLTIGLLIDVSGSQINLIEQERRAGGQFFSSVLRKKDMAFLIQFGAESELLQDMTGTPRLLQDGLRRLKPNTGMAGIHPGPVPTMSKQRGTVLFDAVYVASKDMLANEVGRKAIVIITDGEDFGSTESERTAIEAAQKSDAIIYGILYADRQFYGSMNLGSGGGGVLRHMAEETGGHMFQVDRRSTLESIFDQIQQEMRSQYLIGYTPTNGKRDGGYRKIDLKPHDKDLKVQVRKGYYAGRN